MKRFKLQFILILALILSHSLCAQEDQAIDVYHFSGRIERLDHNQVKLIGSASSVAFQFEGDSCDIILSVDNPEFYNYVSLELDGKYRGRVKVETGKENIIPVTTTQKKPSHTLIIYKATEPSNGGVIFHDAKADKLLSWQQQPKKKVEFIGDSVFCGQGIDFMEINCGTEKHWYDQHNAYLTFPVLSSKMLQYDFLISAVSGIGMYRTWNTEASQQKAMPFVYNNLYLDKKKSKPYDYSFNPDIIVIGIGNNDFYTGDAKAVRESFNSDLFTTAYINFMEQLIERNPNASFVLITPLVDESKLKVATACMEKIKEAFPKKKVDVFTFKPLQMHGCYEHPDIKDSKIMSKQFVDFMRKLDQ
jgi:hypothetical protein